ncbi:hypothetical protein FOQG_01737 [Fusarium oxysporum f. sp. raphani 54005]|uniref:Uncharacterized protein n=3 Tax=Fusarium oxysporum TaxID=5507 RepID=X0CX67_FUSOX|nr:hypothetical protein FOVG_09584 [Fusarium oxysporum f. sp. pisi HDV247]EXK99090.1 hypothetical protein FOQG_01737 [Fusarium oxysporum f. sp. raphani 54005]EXL87982.1 hypothetical protein FOPG_01005 [Fusarium oxysporum f. sp. conglutinans race 2 54008]KAI8408624.1 hypothetical protein FOFC_11570 [Fusarium oxysporum]
MIVSLSTICGGTVRHDLVMYEIWNYSAQKLIRENGTCPRIHSCRLPIGYDRNQQGDGTFFASTRGSVCDSGRGQQFNLTLQASFVVWAWGSLGLAHPHRPVMEQ